MFTNLAIVNGGPTLWLSSSLYLPWPLVEPLLTVNPARRLRSFSGRISPHVWKTGWSKKSLNPFCEPFLTNKIDKTMINHWLKPFEKPLLTHKRIMNPLWTHYEPHHFPMAGVLHLSLRNLVSQPGCTTGDMMGISSKKWEVKMIGIDP